MSQVDWIGVTVGYGGYYKTNDWVPVTLLIHHVGPQHKGTLEIQVNQTYPNGKRIAGTLEWPENLPTNGWIRRQVAIPGNILSQGASVSLISGGQTLYNAPLSGNPVNNVSLVAVLTTTTQDTQFLAGSSTTNGPVLPVAVDPSTFPTTYNLLNGLDAVAVTVDTLSALTPEQQDILRNWVKLGGLLVVMGTGDVGAQWNDLPMTQGVLQTADPSGLQDFVDAAPPAKSFPISVGQLAASARLWAGTRTTPLLASTNLGRGQIWQTSFSPTDPTILGWSGDAQMWTNVFMYGANSSSSAVPSLFNASGAFSLTSVGDALAPLRVPSLFKFAIIFAFYVLLIGPGAFFLLHRWRKATWAWALLPFLSAVMTVGIYVIGGSERPGGLLMDGVGVLDLTGDGSAESYGVQAFMSPYVGGLNFTMPAGSLAVAMSSQDKDPVSATVSVAKKTTVSFADVPRWHVRYVYASGMDVAAGQVDTKFTEAYGYLFGSVRNDTLYTLNNAAVVWGRRIMYLGQLKPGQSKTINVDAEKSTSSWISDYGTYNRELTHGIGRSLGAYLSQFSDSSFSTTIPQDTPQALIIATTDARTPQLPAPGGNQHIASDKTLVLVREFANVKSLTGDDWL